MNTALSGLGVCTQDAKVLLFFSHPEKKDHQTHGAVSLDGISFQTFPHPIRLLSEKSKTGDMSSCQNVRISSFDDATYLTYVSPERKVSIAVSLSAEFTQWKHVGSVPSCNDAAMLVPHRKHHGQYIIYSGGQKLNVGYSRDLISWGEMETVYSPPPQNVKKHLTIVSVFSQPEGIFVLYRYDNALHVAVCDVDDPTRMIYHPDAPVWEFPQEWQIRNVQTVGAVVLKNRLFSYWSVSGRTFYAVAHAALDEILPHFPKPSSFLFLKKIKDNPILSPIIEHFWESKATFNPAALYEAGKVHLVYRAVGDHDISVLGYAASADGMQINERSDEPIYVPTQPFEGIRGKISKRSPFVSGIGWGGCEDPRLTKIDDQVYMTYVAFDGWNPPRSAITSIALSDFLGKNWNWTVPILLSPPGVVNKNVCILPKKIDGKYVIFHRVFPNILIDFVDDLTFAGGTRHVRGQYAIEPRRMYWDSRKVGAGAPPIDTDDGWLLIYHAVGDQDAGRYKIGAMLLDKSDPTRVLYRSRLPILVPDEWYENDGWKSGVAYPCGAIVKDNKLLVYYGGADKVTCVAHAHLPTFLHQVKAQNTARLTPLQA